MFMLFSNPVKAAAFCALMVPVLMTAADNASETRRWSIGFRIQAFPSEAFRTGTAQASTTAPAADYTYTGSSGSGKAAPGPVVQFRLWKNLSLTGEMRVHEAWYIQQTEIRNGRKNPDATSDDRNVDTRIESSAANYWEFPVLAQYQIGQFYVTGGIQLRHIGRVRTGTEYTYADGATDYNETPAQASLTNQVGFVVGAGIRVPNIRRVRVLPEIRYIHMRGTAFQGPSYRSASKQVEIGIGFMF
jgi:hypothetical protein